MPWQPDGAYALGLSSPPEAGDQLLVILENEDDPDNPLREEITWTWDGPGVMSLGQFRLMCLAQLQERIDALNTTAPMTDVTDWLFGV